LVQGKVLFNNAGAQGDGGEADFDSFSVIRITDGQLKGLLHRLHRSKINI